MSHNIYTNQFIVLGLVIVVGLAAAATLVLSLMQSVKVSKANSALNDAISRDVEYPYTSITLHDDGSVSVSKAVTVSGDLVVKKDVATGALTSNGVINASGVITASSGSVALMSDPTTQSVSAGPVSSTDYGLSASQMYVTGNVVADAYGVTNSGYDIYTSTVGIATNKDLTFNMSNGALFRWYDPEAIQGIQAWNTVTNSAHSAISGVGQSTDCSDVWNTQVLTIA